MTIKSKNLLQPLRERVGQLIGKQRKRRLLAMLSGRGLEIGALHLPVAAPHLDIRYVDRMSCDQLRQQYPELEKLPLVEPDIIDDGEHLANIEDDSQDFVIASHLIEHIPNPIQGLLTWQRVLKPKGRLYLAVPDKRFTFDRNRALTDIEHLRQDYESPSRERDFLAYKEFALQVSCREFNLRPESEYAALAQELFDQHYSIHYHVWEYQSFIAFMGWLDRDFPLWQMRCVATMPTRAGEFALVLEKPAP